MSQYLDQVTDADTERFWNAVTKTGTCWLWTSDVNSRGYGRHALYRGGVRRRILAHRLSYWIANGDLPQLLRHTCDTPSCVNPGHLIPGTQAQNVRDALDRGRSNLTGLDAFRDQRLAAVASRVASGMKTCRRCSRALPISAFHRHSRSADGLQFWCAVCMRARKVERKAA